MCSSVSSRLRFLLSLALLAIIVAMPSAARAQACQASGSIQVNPQSGTSCATGLLAGGTLDISYFITNTSSNGTPGPQVAAVLSGTTVATLACDNSSCALQGDPATFVPVGVDGCVSKASGVLNCSAGGVNQAVINMAAGGVALAAGQQIFLATIRVQVGANAVVGCNSRFTRADTGPNDMTTDDPACDPAVSGGGQGSSSFKKVECTTGVLCRPSSGQCDVPETCNAQNTCPPDGKAPSTTTCVGTSNGGPCDGTDSCDGAGNCVDGYKPMTTTCRPAVGQCDVAESCSGTSGACPADGFQPSTTACTGNSNGGPCDGTDSCDGAGHCVDGFKPMTTICRDSVGQCDVAESCSGSSGACPADAFQPSTTACIGNSNGGPCDGTDSCDGAGHCIDGFKPMTTICRASVGQCDVAESCSGSSGACPADAFQPSTTACIGNSNGGPCDGTDSCDGAGHCVDGYAPATTICRQSTGQCDPAESCTGTSGSCPSNSFSPSTTSCTGTSNGGPCDGTDSCDGAGHCVDGYKPMTTTCRQSTGQCDPAESCTGTSGSCPSDSFSPSTTSCTGTSNGGPCDGTDSCDGAGHCVDGFKPMTTTCRQSTGQCDPAESCTGSSGACPANSFSPSTTACTGTSNGGPCDGTDSCDGNGHCVDGYKPSTTICRAATGVCDVAESCTGTGGACPADGFQPSGTTCPDTDGDRCTIPACDGLGNCIQTSSTDPSCQATLCRVTGGGFTCQGQGECCDPVTGDCAANTGSNGHSVTCRRDRDCNVFGGTYPVCTFCTEDPNTGADIGKATFGGQVGAPYVTPGCHDNDTCVQGNWTHQRHQHDGSLHAQSFYSMVCNCDEGTGVVVPGVCGDRNSGPTPPAAPANMVCFTGTGRWAPTSGRRDRPVAFRVEIEDRGEPGGGQNAGNLSDVYRMRIWYATNDADALAKVEAACCQNPISAVVSSIGQPDILDGGNLTHGNLQIHKLTGNPNNTDIPPACFVPGAN